MQGYLAQLAEEKKETEQDAEKMKVLRSMVSNGSRISDEDLLPLAVLTAPGNDASDETVKDYIAAVLATSESSGSFSQNDIQVKLLTKLGRARLPMLLEMMTSEQQGSRASYYLRYAVEALADNSSQDLVLNTLQAVPHEKGRNLLGLVDRMHWEKEAEPILIRMIEEQQASANSSYIDGTLLNLLVKLNDPETYPLLSQAVAKSSNIIYNYGKLKALEDFDFEKLIEEAWENRAGKSGQELLFIAQFVAQKGNPIALDLLVSGLTTSDSSQRMQFEPRFALLAAIDFRGTDAEIIAWYNENQSRLKYDEKLQKFVVTDVQ